MANEIWHSIDEAEIIYALIWKQSDNTIYNVEGASAGTFEAYTDADIDDYNLELTNAVDSDFHAVDFPAGIAAGVYYVQIMRQDGAVADTPDADLDVPVAQGVMCWDGTAEITLATIDTVVDAILTDTGSDTVIINEEGTGSGGTIPIIVINQ